jgi:prolipoprotein diacylglyceryltransferase
MEFLFAGTIACLLFFMIFWGIKTLPGERWQILASIPVSKDGTGAWRGLNLTYYGLLAANANFIAVFVFLALLGSLGIPLVWTLVFSAIILLICIPSSKVIAILVEKKKHTLTVGGASFLGILIAPWIISAMNAFSSFNSIHALPVLSSMAISYALGEGMGRLACLSFGCCYGKPLSECSPEVQRLFKGFYLVFSGITKKVSYESGLSGKKLVPVQAITSILFVSTGIASMVMFFNGHFMASFVVPIVITQVWRTCSEFLRADYRGGKKISAYQIMALIAVFYAAAMGLLFPVPDNLGSLISIAKGLSSIWNPLVALFLLVLWTATFLFTGRSMVTYATMSFHVAKEKI